MAVINSVGNSLTGLTGTGNFVGATSPTLITPNIGVATGTSLNLSASTLINGVIDDDTMATASATNVPTSESVVAYISSFAEVVQYVYTTYSAGDDTSTSITLANSSITAGITPTNTTNRILIIASVYATATSTNMVQNYNTGLAIYRSTGTPAYITGRGQSGVVFGVAVANNASYNVMTPIGSEISGDTNLHTYNLQFASGSASATSTLVNTIYPAQMLLVELKV